STTITHIDTPLAAKLPIPSSQGAVAGNLVFTSGHGPRRPDNTLAIESFRAQLEQTISNISEVLQAGGSDLAHCVRMLVLLRSADLIPEFNAVYEEIMPQPFPPRMTMIVGLTNPD